MTELEQLKKKVELAKNIIPLFEERFEISQYLPQELVGLIVISIRNGFGYDNQIMKIDSISSNSVNTLVNLKPTEYSSDQDVRGWQVTYKAVSSSFILYSNIKRGYLKGVKL